MGNQQSIEDSIKRAITAGWSYRKISEELHVSSKTISRVVSGDTFNHQRGRPHSLTQEMIDYIELNSLANATLTDGELTAMLNKKFDVCLNRTTIGRKRKELGFIYRPPLTKQSLTEEQKQLRINFCRWILENQEKLPYIVFSDESRFSKGPDNRWRRIKRGHWNDSCFIEQNKFTPSIMVWGAIGLGYRTALIRCSSSEDADEYINILKTSHIIEDCDQRYGQHKWYYMHDGAPCHNSSKTINYLKDKVLIVPGWPPNSPDLNPIEILWGVLKKKLKKYFNLKNNDQLMIVAQEFWLSLDDQIIDNLIKDFLRRCSFVLEVGGESISQYLSSHKTHPEKPVEIDVQYWSKEEDQKLCELNNKYGNKWKKIGEEIGRSRNEVKWRLMMLKQIEQNNMKSISKKYLLPIEEMDSEFDFQRIFCEWKPLWSLD